MLDDCWQRLLHTLKFDQMDSRQASIGTAHRKTCRWFLNDDTYKAWLDPEKLKQHHGFLWIRGKPGAGKSTIMKFAYSTMRKTRQKHGIICFFFNARGEILEKSVAGMYRSLLLQLLQSHPDLQTILDNPDLVSQNWDDCPPLNILKDLFHDAVLALGQQRPLTCLIDALDECDEQQILDMVQYFEDLAEDCTENDIQFRTLFSSRHYPHISIRCAIQLTLEDQLGHGEDLESYVTSRLTSRFQDDALVEELRTTILEKAAGVFMWVAVVVDILIKEYARGGLALRKRLEDLPSSLDDLFRDILTRNNDNKDHLLLCILWVLCAKRPLRPDEFYHAVWSGLLPKGLADPELPDTAGTQITLSVTGISKGLAEVTKGEHGTVQFIHESVRDYLLKPGGLRELWPDLGFHWETQSHERLKECCDVYVRHYLEHGRGNNLLSNAETTLQTDVHVSKNYSFLEYASQHVLYHANIAADAENAIPQTEFLSRFPLRPWISIVNDFEKYKSRRYTPEANLLYVLADRGYSMLIRIRLRVDPKANILGNERYRYPLFAALAHRHKDSVAALLKSHSIIYEGLDITEGLERMKDLEGYRRRTPLTWAAQEGRSGIVKLLLLDGTRVDELDYENDTALRQAAAYGHEAAVRLLIENGADVSAKTPLRYALQGGHEAIARLLIENGADVNAGFPLQYASQQGNEAIVRLLIENGAEVNKGKPLRYASQGGHEAATRLLIENGADVNAGFPLQCASQQGNEAIVRLLIENGAEVNKGKPLRHASQGGHEAATRLLIENGADVNAGNPLQYASQQGNEAIVRLLIEKGADVNAGSPLLYASQEGNEAMVRLLIEKGADVNAGSPLYYASRRGNEAMVRLLIEKGADVNAGFPLQCASQQGNEALVRLLIENGADVEGGDPLQYALRHGYETIARLLIEKGTDVNRLDTGSPPLIWASVRGYEAVARLLIENGADVNVQDVSGSTPLIWASKQGSEVVARLLIQNGADIHAVNQSGGTPLSYATEGSHHGVAQLLLAAQQTRFGNYA